MALQINSTIANLRCSLSGTEVARDVLDSPVGLCSCCPRPGKPLTVEYDLERVARASGGRQLTDWPGAGIWRYSPLLPVIGVPIASGPLKGVDALYAIVQMPPGVPVATVGINNARNAAILAAEILSLSDETIRGNLDNYRARWNR